MRISIIAAVADNNAIGKENNLLCYLPADLKYFKELTIGNTIVMGRKTFMSLPKGALPNRRNIVLSHGDNRYDGVEVVHSLAEAVSISDKDTELFFIGGATVYEKAMDMVDRLYITEIKHSFADADTFFPHIDFSLWKEISRNDCLPDGKNPYPYSFVVYDRCRNKL